VLGGLCALFTNLRRGADGTPLSRAGWIAAILWVAGIGARMGCAYATSHGAGPAIGRFSVAHSITSVDAWVAALSLMALAEVVTRLAVLWLRSSRLPSVDAPGPAGPAGEPFRGYSTSAARALKDSRVLPRRCA
jgi:hypothetical protein